MINFISNLTSRSLIFKHFTSQMKKIILDYSRVHFGHLNNIMRFLAMILFLTLFFSCTQKQDKNHNNNLGPLEKLKAGNEKFVSGHPVHPHETPIRVRELKKAQHPFVVLIALTPGYHRN